MLKPRETCEAAVARFGVERVLVPDLLRIRMRQKGGDGKMTSAGRNGTSCRRRRMPRTRRSRHLARQGFATYLPRYLKRRRHARRVEIGRRAFVSALSLRRNRHGGAALALDLFDRRRFAARLQRRLTGACPDEVIELAEAPRRHVRTHPARSSAEISRPATRSAFWKAHFTTVSEFMTACRTASASRFCSIFSAARFACCWMPRP